MRGGVAGCVAAEAVLSGIVLVLIAAGQPIAAADRPWLAGLERTVAILLAVGAGLLAVVPRPALAALAGLTALAISSFAFVGRQGRLEGLGMVASALVVPLLMLIVLLVPSKRPGYWWVVLLGIAAVAVVRILRTLVYEPFVDRDCVGLCRHNPILVTTNLELAQALGLLGAAALVGLSVLIVLHVIYSFPTGRQRGSHRRLVQWCSCVAVLILGADSAFRLATDTVAVPGHVTANGLTVTLAAAAVVSVTLFLIALDPLRARRDVGRVARMIERAGQESDVQTILRNTVGDPHLRVGYWVVDGDGYLDRNGQPVAPSGLPQVELTERGAPLAVIVPDRAAVWPQLLAQRLGAQARLAIHNESLTFELNRRVHDVSRSRRRIVEVGDAERQRLERDLHDGAQQRLLALSFELRRGERAAIDAHDERSVAAFTSANALAQTALAQLRDLAHGIHPGPLSAAGLQEALNEFADLRGHDVAIDVETNEPLAEQIASTIYRIVTATITSSADSTMPCVLVRRRGRAIAIAIDGVDALPQHAADRAAAIGGVCTATNTGVEVALPCGS